VLTATSLLLALTASPLHEGAPAARCEASDAVPGVAAPVVAPVSAPASVPVVARLVADSALLALFASGETYETFLANAQARKAMWQRHWDEGQVPADILERARAIPGRWRLLVVAVDGCSDSVNTVPYLARLASLVPSLELRIVKPAAGRAIQEAHRTPDGRAATPTLVVLDDAGRDVGCWVERPGDLVADIAKARAEGRIDSYDKQGWYDRDAGVSTLREVVAVVAAAAAGTPACGATPPPARTP
jgi:hypothetical protein